MDFVCDCLVVGGGAPSVISAGVVSGTQTQMTPTAKPKPRATLITPEIGKIYLIKHSSGKIPMKFTHFHTITSTRNLRTQYHFLNLKTGRPILIKSRLRILKEYTPLGL